METITILFIITCIIIVFLLTTMGVGVFVIYNLYKKNLLYENWFEKFTDILLFVDKGLKDVDNNGAFASDDEVGWAFSEIRKLWQLLIQMGVMSDEEEKLNEGDTGKTY